VLVPNVPLLKIAFYSQVLQGLLLPFELVLMLIVINRFRVMGVHRNSRSANIIGWATVIIVGAIALYYTAQQVLSGGGS
jgi:Mn2+/Fe2+ NRAMP family transporter